MFDKSKQSPAINEGDIIPHADLVLSCDRVTLQVILPKSLTRKEADRLMPGFDMAKSLLEERVVTDTDAVYQRSLVSPAMNEDDEVA